VYPSLRRIGSLHAPLLVLHGDRDQTVPLRFGQSLFDAAPEPKCIHVFPGLEHDVSLSGAAYARVIADFASAVVDG
jgi:fermentation-respiration switch protein FrsA (DUF1100 family)